eukprot:TRINITY_DN22151_c0_g1_i1.p1 TRINITY_DN22151_c0_g1~~TRINITY_DN22151_c0_g1_i1.p1  ORF type:complete len:106 (-),score=34.36 TRINITY_DN22151_c0_g1_i1:61-378(-)
MCIRDSNRLVATTTSSIVSSGHQSIECYLVRRELVPEGTYEALGETPSAAIPTQSSKSNPSQQRGTKHLSLQPVSYTHLRAHETPEHLVCRLLLEKKKTNTQHIS